MEPTFVRVRDCSCPDTPHAEGDGVYLRPFLGFVAGAEAQRAIVECAGDLNRLNETLGPVYIRHGVVGWNLDEPFDVERVLEWDYEQGIVIVEAADALYTAGVMRPLTRALNGSSSIGRTATTSATSRSSRNPRRPSKRSSRATSVDGKRSVT